MYVKTLALALSFAAFDLLATPVAFDWQAPERAPAKVARPFGGFFPDGRFIMAGGSNFENGQKVWTDGIYLREKNADGKGVWKKIGVLPRKMSDGVTCETGKGVFCAGGTDGKAVFREAFLLTADGGRVALPDLPEGVAMGAAAADGSRVYVVGHAVFSLDLAAPERGWTRLPDLPEHPERTQPVAAIQNGDQKERFLIVFGGYAKDGALTDGWGLSLTTKTWRKLASLDRHTTIGAAFLPSGNQHILLIGGFGFDGWNGRRGTTAKELGWQRKILAYSCVTDVWCEYGEIAADDVPRCGAAAGLRIGKTPEQYEMLIVGGEEAPRVRTDRVTTASFRKVAKFKATSWIVVGIYALLMAGMAFYFIRKKKDENDYFRGGNRIPWYVAGMSIFATMLSSITFIAVPTQAYLSDWRYYVLMFFVIGMAPVAIYFYLPFFCRLHITSAYEYLEKRFNLGVRLFGSAAFVVFMVCRVAVVTLLPAIALNAVTGVSIDACILICGIVTMVYCSLGGLEAVVWSDFVQGIVLMGGALSVLVLLVMKTGPEGAHLATFWDVATTQGKTTLFDFRWLATEPVFWVVAVQGLVSNLSSYTSDQCVIQRYIATPDEKATRRSIWFNGTLSMFSSATFFAIGTALYTHYRTNPAMMDVTMPKSDSVFPLFMATEMPPWLAGLVIAAIFAATISTLSANLSSASTAIVTDYIKRFRPSISGKAQIRCGQISTYVIGLLGLFSALALSRLESRALFDNFQEFIAMLTAGLTGLFFMGVFMPRVKGGAAVAGLLANYLVCFGCKVCLDPLPFHPFLLGGIGLAVCLIVSFVCSLVFREKGHNLAGLSLRTLNK